MRTNEKRRIPRTVDALKAALGRALETCDAGQVRRILTEAEPHRLFGENDAPSIDIADDG